MGPSPTPEDLTEWLDQLGLGKYAAAFVGNDVDFRALSALSEQDLKDLGVSLGHRRILQQAIGTLSDGDENPLEARPSPIKADSDANFGSATWERHPGERKPVTLLYADISGSTALTQHLDAEEAHELLYGVTQRMCEAVESSRGTVCRFMGDGVMAMFGAPVASEHHAVDACEAALAMQRAVRDYTSKGHRCYGSGLAIRIGLHSGEVVVLSVGEGDKAEYDASGPAVPIAARMEQIAEPGEIYLTAATYGLAGGRIVTRALDPVRVKGVSEPLPVFVLEALRTPAEADVGDARTPFVGRRGELSRFRRILANCVKDSQGRMVYVRGEPGIGKTRLVGEFVKVASESGASTHRGLVLPFGVGRGQDAIRSLVRSLLGIAPGADETDRQTASEAVLHEGSLLPDQSAFLNDLLNLPQTLEQRALYDAMDNAARNVGKGAVVSALIVRASKDQPVLVIIEDLHWVGRVTMTYLAMLTKTVAENRALLVVTSRIEGDPLDRQWLGRISGAPFVAIELGPLRREDSAALVAEFIDSTGPLAKHCLDRAAGNPFFLEQLLRAARETTAAKLPDSIQSLVLARADRLQPEDKRALQSASVIGQRFDREVLRCLLAREDYDCHALVEHNLVRPEGAAYLFCHALIQEGVYGSLLTAQRRILHDRAAEWFTLRDKTLHAQHLDRADDDRAPAAYLDAAREQAKEYQYETARRLIERGLELAPQGAERHPLICFKADLLLNFGEVEASIAAYKEAEEWAGDDRGLVDARIGLASCLRMTSDYQGALVLLERSEPVAVRLDLAVDLSRLHHLRGNLYFSLGNIDGCREEHQRALQYARAAGSVEDEARALGGLGDAEYGRGRMKSAFKALRICVDRCRQHGFGRIEVANLTQMAAAQAYTGDCKEALGSGLKAVRSASAVSHERAEMVALFVVGHVAFSLADVEQMESAIAQGKALNDKLKARAFQSAWIYMSALALYLRGERDLACEVLEPAIQYKPAHAFFGPFVFGALSMASTDRDNRAWALREGERLLAEGSMGAGYLQFYRFGIEGCLDAGEWATVDRYTLALEAYTRAEPLPLSDFFIARGRALSTTGRGEVTDSSIAELIRLRDDAERMHVNVAIPKLDDAIKSF